MKAPQPNAILLRTQKTSEHNIARTARGQSHASLNSQEKQIDPYIKKTVEQSSDQKFTEEPKRSLWNVLRTARAR